MSLKQEEDSPSITVLKSHVSVASVHSLEQYNEC